MAGVRGGKLRDDFLGRRAALTERAEAEGVVAFREADAGFVEHKRGVVINRRGRTERAEEEELAKGGFHEVGAADDFGDAEIGVIDGAGELVAGDAVFSPNEKIAEVAAGGGDLRAERGVFEGERFTIGDAEAPVDGEGVVERRERRAGGRAELRRVNRLVVFTDFMRRADGIEDIAARACAGENLAGGVEAREGGAVERETFALGNDGFLPREAEPAEIFEHGGDEIEAEADGVEIVVAQEERAVGRAGAVGGDPECARVPEVEMAGGRGGEAADIRRCRRRVEG